MISTVQPDFTHDRHLRRRQSQMSAARKHRPRNSLARHVLQHGEKKNKELGSFSDTWSEKSLGILTSTLMFKSSSTDLSDPSFQRIKYPKTTINSSKNCLGPWGMLKVYLEDPSPFSYMLKTIGSFRPLSRAILLPKWPNSMAFFTGFTNDLLQPGRLTWNIIIEVGKIMFLSKRVICRFHVNIPGCNWDDPPSIYLANSNELLKNLNHSPPSKGSVFCRMASTKNIICQLPWNMAAWHMDEKNIYILNQF